MVYFTAVETKTLTPQVIPDPGTDLTDAQHASSVAIANGFITSHDRLLAESEIERRIAQIETIFIALGRFHELMSIYRDDYEARGPKSHVADRYAWGLVRLEHETLARKVIDELVEARPDDARVHFLDGAYYLKDQPPALENFPNIVAAWTKLLEVDPEFQGFEGVDAPFIRQQVARFDAQIPASMRIAAEVEAAANDVDAAQVPEVEDTAEVPEAVEVPVEVPEVVAEAPADVPAPVERPDAERVKLLVARGEIALSQGKIREAEDSFIRAKAIIPDSFEAHLGHLKAGWETVAARNRVSTEARQLTERTDLTAEQHIQLGQFLWAKLGRNDLAKAQWEAAKQKDPAVASRVDTLLKRLK